MSENTTYQRQQRGPGPPSYMPQMMSAFSSPEAAPVVSPRPAGLSPHKGVTIDQQVVMAGQPMGQGFRMDQHPAGLGFVPAGFQAVCGTDTAHGTRVPMAAPPPGYYAYPSVASLYPYGVIGQSASAPVALDPERFATVNRALGLAQPAPPAAAASTTTVHPGAMELAWRMQYPQSSATWPVAGSTAAAMAAAASHVAARSPNPSFRTAAAVAAAVPAAPPSKASAVMMAMMASTLASTPPKNSPTNNNNNNDALAAAAAVMPPSSVEATLPTSCKVAAAGGGGATTATVTMAESKADREQQNSPAHSSAAAAAAAVMAAAAVAEAGDNAGEFEVDSTGKRRRLTAQERLQRSRERNQLHARKTRQRKKAQLQLLQQRSANLQAEQQRLRQAITDRRTASILLGMSGSEDVQAGGQASKASRDHPPALAAMSGRTPRAGMLSALEGDDTGEGSGKGVGGKGYDDLSSESASFAGTSCSGSSGRTSSEANSSDGAVGGEDRGGGGGGGGGGRGANGSRGAGGGEGQAEEKLKVGNPGDTERLLELSQKTRSECTPEELEQIRRERNRMHAKRTRDRKKLHLEATEGMIARLEQENSKMRDSMKAMGSGVVADPAPSTVKAMPVATRVAPAAQAVTAVTAVPALPAAPATTDAVVTSGVPPQGTHVSGQQQPRPERPVSRTQQHSGGAQAHLSHPSPPPPPPPPPLPPAAASHSPAQQYASHAFLHHAPQIPPQLHGHVYSGAQHHLPPQVLQQAAPEAHHVGYFAHGFKQSDRTGARGGGGGGGGVGDVNRAGGIVKADLGSYMPGGQMAAMGCIGHHSNPHYQQHAHPPLVPYQLPPTVAFAPNAAGKSHVLSPSPQQQQQQQAQAQHVYPMPDVTTGCKWWNPTADGREAGAAGAAPSLREPESVQKSGCKERDAAAPSVSDKKNWGAISNSSGSKTASSSNGNTSSGSKKSADSSSSSSPSSAGNGAARHLARARADQARAAEEKSRTEDEHKLDRDLSRGCQEAWQKVRRERSANKRKRVAGSGSGGGGNGGGDDVDGHSRTAPSIRGAASSSSSSSSDSEQESGGGSGGEGSECASSSSSWMESSESSSVLPGSSTSGEDGGGRDSASRTGSDSTRSTGSPDSSSFSESGWEDGGASAADDEDATAPSDMLLLDRRSLVTSAGGAQSP